MPFPWRQHRNPPVEEDEEATVQGFTVPLKTLGLHVLNSEADEVGNFVFDVVAVHGLGGDAFSTWTSSGGTMWLHDLLLHSGGLAKARVLTYGYDATAFMRPFKDSSNGRTLTFAEGLLSDLADQRAASWQKYRPIFFVGHSMGGLVIKEALCYAHARPALYGDILQSTKCIFFFGTPHQGSDAAVWANMLSKLTTALRIRSSNVLTELQTWSIPLVDLTTKFSQLAPDFAITTFFETADTYGVRVVPEGSARMGQRNERTVGLIGNHLQICRFKDETDPNYKRVLQRFKAEAVSVFEHERTGEPLTPITMHRDFIRSAVRDIRSWDDKTPADEEGAAGLDASLQERLSALPRPQR